jgi:signal transduction histidine kinase
MIKHNDKSSHAKIEVNLNKLYEQVLKAKADWQNTFDSISDMICILDKDARITRMNRSFSARMNKPYEFLLGKRCHEAIHATCSPSTCPFSTVMETKQSIRNVMEMQIGDAVFTTSLFPFFDAESKLHGAVYVFRDITDQKILENKLIQSDKMAAIGTLAAEIAHEINNPLDYITNYLYLLSESLPPEFDKREYLKKIEAGIDNLSALTRDLLEFSRPQIDVFVPLEMHKVIDESLEFSGKYLQEKQVKVIKNYRCRTHRVAGSVRMLQQVLLNLILNSLDALPNGGTITITSSTRNGHFILEIEDTGVGIPEANLPRIFEPFFTTKKNFEKRGTGLGLTICYNIIYQHKGEIRVSSKIGEGTKFTITFPLYHEEKGHAKECVRHE